MVNTKLVSALLLAGLSLAGAAPTMATNTEQPGPRDPTRMEIEAVALFFLLMAAFCTGCFYFARKCKTLLEDIPDDTDTDGLTEVVVDSDLNDSFYSVQGLTFKVLNEDQTETLKRLLPSLHSAAECPVE